MKKVLAILLTCLCLCLLSALAEGDGAVKGIFDVLTDENSNFSRTKALSELTYPGAVFEETLQDDGFTIAISGTEYMDGTWHFVAAAEDLTLTVANDDFTGLSVAMDVVNAVGTYYGMDTDVIGGYVNGLSALGIESDNFSVQDEGENALIRINIAGPWDMKELDEMALEADVLSLSPLTEDHISAAANLGKVMMVANGTSQEVTILLGEYGGLDGLAYRSLINVVNALKPEGYEDFTASYTELTNAQGENWTVRLDVDLKEVGEIIEDVKDSYSYAIIHFGA